MLGRSSGATPEPVSITLIVIRSALTPESAHASMIVSSGKGLALQYRTASGGASVSVGAGAGVAPVWLRLVRSGATLTAYRAPDGATWTKVGAVTINMAATVYVGLALTSHNNTMLATADYDNITIGGSAPAWQDGDVGSVAIAGSFSQVGDTFSVRGAGADIWGTADAFHFVYQPLVGDGQIVGRVASVEHTNDWAKAGVMIRETLAAGSKHASLFVSAARGVAFQRRTTTGGTSVSAPGSLSTPPQWVKLTRAGSTIAAYESADGVSWRLVGTDDIAMTADVLVGLAVTSHNAAALCTAALDSIAR